LGFVPVAIHFDLFNILAGHGTATADEVTKTCNERINARAKNEPELSTCLTAGTLSWALILPACFDIILC
jgi:hypothetical protein